MKRLKPEDLRLYFVLDREVLGARATAPVLHAAVQGGITCVQLRDKISSDDEFVRWAKPIADVLKARGIPLIINDRIEVAQRLKADGVHLGASDRPWIEARRALGPAAVIGLSVESEEEAAAAESADVDYLGVSAIFATATKMDLKRLWGLKGLRSLRGKSRHPLVAIGGIDATNVSAVFENGADGIAVVSAICAAEDPLLATRTLRARVDACFSKTRFSETRTYLRCLTIAGSDSGGGAGIQADLKTFSALGAFGLTAITALTAQNTREVRSILGLSEAMVRDQIEAVLDDIGVDSVKIGMLHSPGVIRVVSETLKKYRVSQIVLDPVMVAKSGDALLHSEAVSALREELWPMARIATPNLPEAEALLGRRIESREAMVKAARALLPNGPEAILLKGGHLAGGESPDLFLCRGAEPVELPGARIETKNTHGTGCTLSSAIAVFLARGCSPEESARRAKDYLAQAIQKGAAYTLGQGHGPVFHFHGIWKENP